MKDQVIHVLEQDLERLALGIVGEAEQARCRLFDLVTERRRDDLHRRGARPIGLQVLAREAVEVRLPILARELSRGRHAGKDGNADGRRQRRRSNQGRCHPGQLRFARPVSFRAARGRHS